VTLPRSYDTPTAFGQALTAAAKRRALTEAVARELSDAEARRYVDRRVNQLRRDAAFHAILVRLGRSTQGQWIVKGGVALQLRLDPSRPSLDIDVAWAGDHLGHAAALADLRATLSAPTDDFFTFELDPRRASEDEAGSLVVPVIVRLGVTEFERFSIDIAPPRDNVERELLEHVEPPLELAQLGIASIALIAVEAQIADKVCAMHEQRPAGPSSRWRDLADIAMMSQQIGGIDAAALTAAIDAEARRRPEKLSGGLPAALRLPDAQLAEWRRAWGKGGRDVPMMIDEALDLGARFLDPVLSGNAAGVWWPDRRHWA
jgi:hypothetical protein